MILHAPTGLRAIAGVYVIIFLFDPLSIKRDSVSLVKPVCMVKFAWRTSFTFESLTFYYHSQREHTDGLSNHSQLANGCLWAHYIRTLAAWYPDDRHEESALAAITLARSNHWNEGSPDPCADRLQSYAGSRLSGTIRQIAWERYCHSVWARM